ncbi:hypothetical protein BCR44DRAFT_1049884 [Catenaria anguillulae PL171]|uniref:Uncharacterized protein n=1 Tax=Catenaria anguillulae PL171 TaxID=765915 RepID=A0A1Y2HV22_9FUNG|nr:hypothetical protein BCR44DRAFT_1049884 [Catenaria anguillulae PL171]
MTSNANSRSSVIFLGSVGGGTAVFPEYLPADLMSKAAVGYLTRHLAAAHSHSPVDVLCVSPGATRTSMFEASTLNAMGPEEKQRFLASMPKGSLIEPDEVAQCVLAIATSGWARILHGACIDASLGLGVRPGLQTEFPAAVPQPAEVKKSLNPSEGSVPPPPSGPPGAQWHLPKRPAFAPPPSATPADDPLSVSLHQLAASLRKPRL